MAFTTSNYFPPSEWPRSISRMRFITVASGSIQALDIRPGHPYVVRLTCPTTWGGTTYVNTAKGQSTTPFYDATTLVAIPGLVGGAVTANIEFPFVSASECVVIDNTSGTANVVFYITPILSHD